MPTTRTYTNLAGAAFQISCTGCDVQVFTDRPYNPDAETHEGGQVSNVFRWRSRYGNFYSQCRNCERAARRRAAERQPNRVASRARRERRYGVELELIFPRSIGRVGIQEALSAEGLAAWRVKIDGSLSGGSGGYGWEVVSPVLQGEDGHDQIRRATRVLRNLGAKPNRSCGLHVHHEVRDLNLAQMKRVVRFWHTNRDLTDGLVSESRRHASAPYYCQALSETEVCAVESLRDIERISQVISGRYKTLNLAAYGRYGTFEIRQHQGTCDPEKIISWIGYGQALIEKAANGTTAEASTCFPRVRDLLGSMGDALNETARTFLLGRAVEFGTAAV